MESNMKPDVQGLVGLTENDASAWCEEARLTTRVTARDGQRFVVTMDYRLDRVNLVIDDGVVTRAHIG